MRKVNSYDLLGSVAIVRFPLDFKKIEKKRFAEDLLKKQKVIKTVLEKQGKIKGRLRKISTNYIAGEKTKEVLYKENNCLFRFHIDKTYFSPRLSNERREIANKIRKGDKILVMFAGVAPLPIVIAKNSKAGKIISNEINQEANKYAKLNIELNKVKNKVELLPGDIKRIAEKICKGGVNIRGTLMPSEFDVIAMPRPQLKDTFLEQAFKLSKKGTRIFYYDFCPVKEKEKIAEKIKLEAKKARKKIKILQIKNAGEIAPYKIRLRVDFKVV